MGQEESGSWLSDAGEFLYSAGEATVQAAEHSAEAAVQAIEDTGAATAEEATAMVSGAEDLPVIGAVVSGAAIGYHLGTAVADGIEGDWNGAADNAQRMSEDAVNTLTGGVYGMANALSGDAIHDAVHEGLQATGNALGDATYDAVQYVSGDDTSSQ